MIEDFTDLMSADQIPQVVQLVRESFPGNLRAYMVYAQHGIGRFLAVSYNYPNCDTDRVVLTAVRDQRVLGFADFRLLSDNRAFLSYICVAVEAHGFGVATRLITSFLQQNPRIESLDLDVFDNNVGAKALYTKLGFKTQASSAWITRDIPEPSGTVQIASLPVAIAAFEAHGFCELEVRRGNEKISIGRLGDEVLRCATAMSFGDDRLLSSIKSVFPEATKAFAVVPCHDLPLVTTQHDIVTVSNRMCLTIDRTE